MSSGCASSHKVRNVDHKCDPQRAVRGLTRNREDDLADIVAGLQAGVGSGRFGEGEHGQRWLLDRVVGDERPDMLHQTAADCGLLCDRSGAQRVGVMRPRLRIKDARSSVPLRPPCRPMITSTPSVASSCT